MYRWMTVLAICAGLSLAACGRITSDWDWNQATGTNTLAAYQSFVRKHPDDERAADARGRILALQDDQAWMVAQRTSTIEGFQNYLQTESGGIHVLEAQAQLTSLQAADAWKAAQQDGSAAALQAFLQKYPQVSESAAAREMLGRLTTRVQLAEARSRSAAAQERDRLQRRFGDLVHEVVVVPPGAPGKPYTVRSAPMSRGDASSVCAALVSAHQSCKVIAAPPAGG